MVEVKGKTLGEKAVVVDLTISSWSSNIADKQVAHEVETSKKAQRGRTKVTKKIFTDLTAITSVTNKMYNEFKFLTTAFGDGGRRILPVDKYETLMKIYRECSDELEKALTEVKPKWGDMCKKAQEDLGDLWNSEEVPSYEEFRRKFGIKLNVLPVPDKGHFIVQSEKALIDEMRKSFEGAMKDYSNTAGDELKVRIAKSIKSLIERLSQENMKFRFDGQVLDSIRELVDILPSLNLFEDPEIATLIKEIKENLYEVTDRDLQHMGKRKRTISKAQAILDKMADYAD